MFAILVRYLVSWRLRRVARSSRSKGFLVCGSPGPQAFFRNFSLRSLAHGSTSS